MENNLSCLIYREAECSVLLRNIEDYSYDSIYYGVTPLGAACNNRYSKVAMRLLEQPERALKVQGKLVLQTAVQKGMSEVALELLKYPELTVVSAKMNRTMHEIEYLFNATREKKMYDVMLALLDNLPDWFNINSTMNRRNLLTISCSTGAPDEVIFKILDTPGCNVKIRFDGCSALDYACDKGRSAVALKILEQYNESDFINVPAGCMRGYVTPLLNACLNYMSEVAIEILKKDKRNLQVLDGEGRSALSYACMNGLEDVALIILDKCDEFIKNKMDKNNKTPLLHAMDTNLTKVIGELERDSDILIRMGVKGAQRDAINRYFEKRHMNMIKSFALKI